MRLLLGLVLGVLLLPSAARADCCTYAAPAVGDLVAVADSAWLTFDAVDLVDDATTHRGAIVALGGVPTTDPLSEQDAGAGLPATDGHRVAWARAATNASAGPLRTRALPTGAGPTDPPTLAADVPVRGLLLRGRTLAWVAGGVLLRSDLDAPHPAVTSVASGVADAALLDDGRAVYVAGGRLRLEGTDLGAAREVLDADVHDGVARIVVTDPRGRVDGRAGETVLVTVASDGVTKRTRVAQRTARPAAALDGQHVVYLARGRAGAEDVFARPVAGGAARNLTRTRAPETGVVADGGLVLYGRGRQVTTGLLLLRRADGSGGERTVGGAQRWPFSQARLAVQADGTAHVAYVDRGTRSSEHCGGLVVRRLDRDGRFGPVRRIAPCSVGTTV